MDGVVVTADAMHAQTTWRPIEGTITTTETSTPYDLVRIVTYLTDDAEQAQGHYTPPPAQAHTTGHQAHSISGVTIGDF